MLAVENHWYHDS